MHMLTTNERLFCEALDTSIPALAGIDVTFREKGIEAAEKQLADYVRATLRTEDYFTVPFHDRENVWCDPADSEIEAAEKILCGELRSCGFPHKFPDTASVDWECNPTPISTPSGRGSFPATTNGGVWVTVTASRGTRSTPRPLLT